MKLVNPEYHRDICIEILMKLEECHELLRQIPCCNARTKSYECIEEAVNNIQKINKNLQAWEDGELKIKIQSAPIVGNISVEKIQRAVDSVSSSRAQPKNCSIDDKLRQPEESKGKTQ